MPLLKLFTEIFFNEEISNYLEQEKQYQWIYGGETGPEDEIDLIERIVNSQYK